MTIRARLYRFLAAAAILLSPCAGLCHEAGEHHAHHQWESSQVRGELAAQMLVLGGVWSGAVVLVRLIGRRKGGQNA
ncbi:MAG: hypothetical protein IT209_06830 [Armatimonadetes bacterium]|nr:hypothetical protein [Armatimonadota bacterium]